MKKPALLILAAAASAASAQTESDWERENADRLKQPLQEQVVPPPPLDTTRLVELVLPPAAADSGFRYYVDPGSLSVGADGIVRYVLVARSPSGVENVSFEGMRCPAEYRVYAVGHRDGSWTQRASPWRPIPRTARAGHDALSRDYFCPARHAILSAEEGRKALHAGGHPGIFEALR